VKGEEEEPEVRREGETDGGEEEKEVTAPMGCPLFSFFNSKSLNQLLNYL